MLYERRLWEWGLPADPCTVTGSPLWQGNRPRVDIGVSTLLEICVWEWRLPAGPCTISGPPLWHGNRPWVDIEVITVLETCVWEWGLPAGPCTVSGSPLWQGNRPWVVEVSIVLEKYVYGIEDYQQILVQYLDNLCDRETDLELILK